MIAPLKSGSMAAARLDMAEVLVGPLVASVHFMNPLTFYGRAFEGWRADITAAKDRMDGLAAAAADGAVIVAGDVNSTPDMRQFRQLLGDGYRDYWAMGTEMPSRRGLPDRGRPTPRIRGCPRSSLSIMCRRGTPPCPRYGRYLCVPPITVHF